MSPVADLLNSEAWRDALADALQSDDVVALGRFLDAEDGELCPPKEDVFRAFELVPPDAVRVVILGQDPYPTPGHAHGLAFSYGGAGARPRSLGNIFKELEADLDIEVPPGRSDLTPWARQGVLLLNTVLTVRAGVAGSHRRKGWEALTDAAIRLLGTRPEPVVFLLWGGDARKRARLIEPPHTVLEAGHPSPLSVKHFRGCRHFSKANACLDEPIDWRV